MIFRIGIRLGSGGSGHGVRKRMFRLAEIGRTIGVAELLGYEIAPGCYHRHERWLDALSVSQEI